MSTQHPDNVGVPFFAPNAVMGGEDEIREAFYAFSHLGCDEQMWDFEGKEVDEFVVEKLLSQYEAFFREHPLGERVFLTPRVPNPALEKAQAKVLLEVLHSIPRHSDVARLSDGRAREPIVELIFPRTTSADELGRVATYYRERVGALADDGELKAWFGEFRPREIGVIPLIEDRPSLLRADEILREPAGPAGPPYQRVFIARSDPALNYGMAGAVLLALLALERLDRLEGELEVPLYPILGVGGAPFRGGLRPDSVARVLARYPSAQTFTIQSAFKYDHAQADVVRAVDELRRSPRGRPLALEEARALRVCDRVAARYGEAVAALAPLIRQVAAQVPRRRMRKLHIGLFGYSRSANGASLPRAIPFCAALYAIGLPPEILGLAGLDDDDREWLLAAVPCLSSDLRDALAYLDPEVARFLPAVAEDVAVAERLRERAPDAAHLELARAANRSVREGETQQLGDLVARQGAIRHFLG